MKQKTIIFIHLLAIALNGLVVVFDYQTQNYVWAIVASFMCGALFAGLIYNLYLHRDHTKRLKDLDDDWNEQMKKFDAEWRDVRLHFGVDEMNK